MQDTLPKIVNGLRGENALKCQIHRLIFYSKNISGISKEAFYFADGVCKDPSPPSYYCQYNDKDFIIEYDTWLRIYLNYS